MAKVRASCPDCGDQEHRSHDMAVVWGPVGQYRFRCPRCERIVLRPAEPRALELLAGAGAEVVTIDLTPDRRPVDLPAIVDPDDYCIQVHQDLGAFDVWALFDATDGLI